MTLSKMHWPTLSTETHFQRHLRCFTPRPRSLHALLVNAVASNPQGTALVCNDTRLTLPRTRPAGGPIGGRLAIAGPASRGTA
jgi:hypothetical protein